MAILGRLAKTPQGRGCLPYFQFISLSVSTLERLEVWEVIPVWISCFDNQRNVSVQAQGDLYLGTIAFFIIITLPWILDSRSECMAEEWISDEDIILEQSWRECFQPLWFSRDNGVFWLLLRPHDEVQESQDTSFWLQE